MHNPGESGKLHGGETSVFYQVTEEMAEATRKLQSPVKTFSWESEEREEGREGGKEMKKCQEKERSGRHKTTVIVRRNKGHCKLSLAVNILGKFDS